MISQRGMAVATFTVALTTSAVFLAPAAYASTGYTITGAKVPGSISKFVDISFTYSCDNPGISVYFTVIDYTSGASVQMGVPPTCDGKTRTQTKRIRANTVKSFHPRDKGSVAVELYKNGQPVPGGQTKQLTFD